MLLLVGAVLAGAVVSALAAARLGVPVLIGFLALGMLLGSDGPGGIEFDDPHIARTVGVVGLAVILFEGGLTTPWRAIRPVLVPATLLSTVGVVVSAVATGAAAYWLFDLSWVTAFMLGAVVASTDAAAVFATLRYTTLRRRLSRVLEAESGGNDPMAVALTIGLIEWLQDPSFRGDDLLLLIVRQLGLGLVVGLAVGAAAAWALARLPASIAPFAPVGSIAVAALGFGAADVIGGSGFLAVYIVGLWVGNTATPLRRELVSFHQGAAFLAQIGLFILLGLYVFPSRLPEVLFSGLALAAFVVFVARPLAVWLSTAFLGFSTPERLLLGWAGLRGAVPIVLATFPQAEGVRGSGTIFDAVFFVVLVSTLVQGTTLEWVARRLGLTTKARPVYRPPIEVAAVRELGSDLLEFVVAPDATVAGTYVRDLPLPRDSLVAVIVRGEESVLPRGSTRIEADDRLYVLSRNESRRAVQQLFDSWEPRRADGRPG
jgi:potassium/hydrogen antiporter